MKLKKLHYASVPIFLLFLYLSLSSSSGGISGQYAAGCTCHGNGISNPNTIVSVTGPSTYQHGQTYTYTITVTNSARVAAGFNLKSNIGTIQAASSGTTIHSSTELSHSTPKSLTAGTATWTFQWKAPNIGSTALQFQIAGNAVNLINGADPNDAWNFGNVPAIPLPVEFESFDVLQEGNFLKLIWSMADQKNVKYFEIERSNNGLDFISIKTVEKKENYDFDTKADYDYLDENLISGTTYYYRIKEVTTHGFGQYTQVKSMKTNQRKGQVVLYPSILSTNTFYIKGIDFTKRKYSVYMAAVTGQFIFESPLNSNEVIIPENVKAGVYMVKIISTEGVVHTGYVIKK